MSAPTRAMLALLAIGAAACTRGDARPAQSPSGAQASAHEPDAPHRAEGALVFHDSGHRLPPMPEVAPSTTREPANALMTRRFGTHTLPIALRTRAPELGQYPCSGCHMHKGLVLEARRVPDAHRNIQPVHPREGKPGCGGCHAADDVELLALPSGERVSLDQAYRLCAQCHNAQVAAWRGGAHGKRLDRWRGPRVVMGCAECHDPHRPAAEPRVPFRAPRLHRPGREP